MIWLGALFSLGACGPTEAQTVPDAVSVAAASDLKFALDELLLTFREAHPEVEVTVTYGSSGAFASQIAQGAPFDVYLSADIAYPEDLARKGFAAEGSVFEYAVGRLVLWVPRSSPLDLTGGMEVLRSPSVQRVAIANPAHAPYGRAAKAALERHQLYTLLEPKLVLGENIAQTAQFVQSGAADIGILALSLAIAPAVADSGRYWEIPPGTFPTLRQGGCVLTRAQSPAKARLFAEMLVSADGQRVLERYGFSPPEGG